MTLGARFSVLVCAALLAAQAGAAPAAKNAHQFGVIGHSFINGGSEAEREQALVGSRKAPLAFVVATGIKGEKEACSDELYIRRRDMLELAKKPVVVLPAASDWSGCKNNAGKSIAIERLNRLRELLYEEPGVLSARPLALSRLSANVKFRSYAENAYWVVGNVLYATVNIPSDNNHYRPEAGRNSEYEDRTVANRFWLNKLFMQAKRKKLAAVVLFSEGRVNILSEEPGLLARLGRSPETMDGYAIVRRQITALAKKYNGKVLLIDTAKVPNGTEPAILWRANIGHVSVGSRTMHVQVVPRAEHMFRLDEQ